MTVGDLVRVLTLRKSQDVLVHTYGEVGYWWRTEHVTAAMLEDPRKRRTMERRIHRVDCGDRRITIYAYPAGVGSGMAV